MRGLVCHLLSSWCICLKPSHGMYLTLPAACMSQCKIIKVYSEVHTSTFSTIIYQWVSHNLDLLNIFSKMECNDFWLKKKTLIALSCYKSLLNWEEYFCYVFYIECWLYNDSHNVHEIYLVIHFYNWNNVSCLPCPCCPYSLTLTKPCLWAFFLQALIVWPRHLYSMPCSNFDNKPCWNRLIWKGIKVKWSHF